MPGLDSTPPRSQNDIGEGLNAAVASVELTAKSSTNIAFSPDGKQLLMGYTRPANAKEAVQNGGEEENEEENGTRKKMGRGVPG